MIRPVLLYGSKPLKERCGSCEHLYEYYQEIAQDMLDTMISHDGVGIASNQIGLGLRLFIFENGKEYVTVRNPIVEFSGQLDVEDEGCLSLPYVQVPVARYQFVSLRGTTPSGEQIRPMLLRGHPARVVQHELDHINGQTILEATSPVERNVARRRWTKRYPRLRKWWDNEYIKVIEDANEKLTRERDKKAPRIILPSDGEFLETAHRSRVDASATAKQLQRRDAHSARPSRQPRNVSPDGGYT